MRLKFYWLALAALFLLQSSALAGAGHDHSHAQPKKAPQAEGGHEHSHGGTPHSHARLSHKKLKTMALAHLKQVKKKGYKIGGQPLADHWAQAQIEDFSLKSLRKNFTLAQITAPQGGSLYLLLNPQGDLADINRTGKFPGF